MSALAVEAACTDARSAKSGRAAKAVVVWPDTVTISIGDTLRLRALLRDNRKLLAGHAVKWTISDSSIAHVLGGLVTGGHTGSTIVMASSDGARGYAYVEVVRR